MCLNHPKINSTTSIKNANDATINAKILILNTFILCVRLLPMNNSNVSVLSSRQHLNDKTSEMYCRTSMRNLNIPDCSFMCIWSFLVILMIYNFIQIQKIGNTRCEYSLFKFIYTWTILDTSIPYLNSFILGPSQIRFQYQEYQYQSYHYLHIVSDKMRYDIFAHL